MKHSICIELFVIILVGCINSPETDKNYLLSFPLEIGYKWEYDTLVENNKTIVLKRAFQGIEKVTTKSGNFDCYKFETSGYLNEKRYHYYYPDIGLVKKVEIIDSLGITDTNMNTTVYKKYVRQTILL